MKNVCMMVTNTCTHDARVLKEAASLTKNGYHVTILAVMGNNTKRNEVIDGFCIKRITRKIKPFTFFGKLEFSLKFIYYSMKEKADIYHAHDLSTLLECFISSRINKSALIYDSHELFVRNYGRMSLGEFSYYFLEKNLIKRVNSIITVNQYISKKLKSRYSLPKDPVVVMNCPVLNPKNIDSSSVFNRDLYNEILNNTANRRIILYQGNIQDGRGLLELVESMHYLSDKEFCLLMIGDGFLKNKLEEIVAEREIKNIYFTGMLNLNQLAEYTKIADLGVILFENNSLNNYYGSPNKLFEYIHGNIPILAPNYPFIRDIIGKYDIGVLIEEITPEKISDRITYVFQDLDKYNSMKNNTIVAKKELNWEIEERKLVSLYDKF